MGRSPFGTSSSGGTTRQEIALSYRVFISAFDPDFWLLISPLCLQSFRSLICSSNGWQTRQDLITRSCARPVGLRGSDPRSRPQPLRVVDVWLRDYQKFWAQSLQSLKRYVEEDL